MCVVCKHGRARMNMVVGYACVGGCKRCTEPQSVREMVHSIKGVIDKCTEYC